jgi:NAD(P)-dependent dehydrogenase (short-subunit alcohol dehydrogenase family)
LATVYGSPHELENGTEVAMKDAKSLADKVVVVTGAGRGIGREIALLAASEGASVVVNDLGGAPDGSDMDAAPANQVVSEIIAGGGKAIANADDVSSSESAKRIIVTAVSTFGKVDCVVNNAGILRDAIFHRMTDDQFERVVRVHLFGSFYVSRAAAGYFREQGHGSFVHFASASGVIGNLAQANYAAAKMGFSASPNRLPWTCSGLACGPTASFPSLGAA